MSSLLNIFCSPTRRSLVKSVALFGVGVYSARESVGVDLMNPQMSWKPIDEYINNKSS